MRLLSLINPRTGAIRTLGSEASKEKGLSLKSVLKVMEHFPIGNRLQYYPEYHKEIKIDTIIVAYVVNDFVIYSNKDIKAIEIGTAGESVEILQDGSPVPIERIFSFVMLIPNIARKEIDFKRAHELNADGEEMPTEKMANDFRRGNSITLFTRNAKAKGILHIDTEVIKSIVFNSGMYAKRKLVMLNPLLDTFECLDLRRFNRINTEIPAVIYHEKNKMKGVCYLQDFSERFVRVEVPKESRMLHFLEEKHHVVLRIDAAGEEQQMVLRGTIFKKRKNNVVISLQNLKKNGRFLFIDELDELFIKATMLGHPKTERHKNS
jgi:hypothetical protein